MKVFIMLPTYNEAGNIKELVEEILNQDREHEIVAVDDDSPDGTGMLLEELSQRHDRLHVVHRKGKRGRGRAGAAGFLECLRLGADIIVEMDADFSHPPSSIPQFIAELENADIVIASRYVNGGRDKRNFTRSMLSRLANIYTRTVSGIPVHDCTSGYRAFRASVLSGIDLRNPISEGPSIVQEVLFRCMANNARIKEIPYEFSERNAGKTKLSLFILLKTLFTITLMGLRYRFSGRVA